MDNDSRFPLGSLSPQAAHVLHSTDPVTELNMLSDSDHQWVSRELAVDHAQCTSMFRVMLLILAAAAVAIPLSFLVEREHPWMLMTLWLPAGAISGVLALRIWPNRRAHGYLRRAMDLEAKHLGRKEEPRRAKD